MTKVVSFLTSARNCRSCLLSADCADAHTFVDLLEPKVEPLYDEAVGIVQCNEAPLLDILTCFNFCTQLEVPSQPRTRFHYLCHECKDQLDFAYKFIAKAIRSDKHLKDLEQNEAEELTELDLIEALEEKLDYEEEQAVSLVSQSPPLPHHDAELENNLAAIFGTDFETEFITSEQEEDEFIALKEAAISADAFDDQVELIDAADDDDYEADEPTVFLEQVKAEEEDNSTTQILVNFVDSDNEEADTMPRHFNFDCELCMNKYGVQSELLRHYDKDHDDKDLHFGCELCGSHFINKNALRIHKRQVHENCEYLDCLQCGRFVLKSFFLLHERRHKWKLQYQCGQCPNSFASKHILHKHMTARHSEKRVRSFACADCQRKFFTFEHLQVHRVVHEDQPRLPHTCTLCAKSFVRQANLKLHMRMHRGQTMDCPHCGKQFVRRKDLEIHVRFHTGEFPYACGDCGKRFAIKSHLTNHERRHRGVQFECTRCDKVFIHASGLREHFYEHTGMPLTCSICQRGFSTKFKVRRHLRSVHQNLFAADKHGYSDALADCHIITNEVQKLEMKREHIEHVAAEPDAEEEDLMEMEMLEEHINPDFV